MVHPGLEKWIAWYADGRKYDSQLYQWEDLPQFGIVNVLLLYKDGSSQHVNGRDLYWRHEGIFAGDNDRDAVLRRLPWVKFGQWTTDEQFKQSCDEALEIAAKWHQANHGNND